MVRGRGTPGEEPHALSSVLQQQAQPQRQQTLLSWRSVDVASPQISSCGTTHSDLAVVLHQGAVLVLGKRAQGPAKALPQHAPARGWVEGEWVEDCVMYFASMHWAAARPNSRCPATEAWHGRSKPTAACSTARGTTVPHSPGQGHVDDDLLLNGLGSLGHLLRAEAGRQAAQVGGEKNVHHIAKTLPWPPPAGQRAIHRQGAGTGSPSKKWLAFLILSFIKSSEIWFVRTCRYLEPAKPSQPAK